MFGITVFTRGGTLCILSNFRDVLVSGGCAKDLLIPPLDGFRIPGVVRVSELLAKEDVEAWKFDAFPFLLPFGGTAQHNVCLKGWDR